MKLISYYIAMATRAVKTTMMMLHVVPNAVPPSDVTVKCKI